MGEFKHIFMYLLNTFMCFCIFAYFLFLCSLFSSLFGKLWAIWRIIFFLKYTMQMFFNFKKFSVNICCAKGFNFFNSQSQLCLAIIMAGRLAHSKMVITFKIFFWYFYCCLDVHCTFVIYFDIKDDAVLKHNVFL